MSLTHLKVPQVAVAESQAGIEAVVKEIITAVRERGIDALRIIPAVSIG
jgi:hypothetical protein